MKIANAILLGLFLLFAYFQLNDPDALIWVIFYCYLALLFGLALWNKYHRMLLLAGAFFCGYWLATTAPGLWDYLTNQEGYTILQGMSDERPYIELSREFGGALVGMGALFFLWRQDKKTRSLQK